MNDKVLILIPVYNEEKAIDGTIFIILNWIIPEFCLELGKQKLKSILENNDSKKHLEKMFSAKGSLLEIEKEIKIAVNRMVKEVLEEKK